MTASIEEDFVGEVLLKTTQDLDGCLLSPGCPEPIPCLKVFRQRGLCSKFVAFGTFLIIAEIWVIWGVTTSLDFVFFHKN